MPTDLLLADANTLLRQGLRSMLAQHAEFNVVAEAGEGKEAARLALQHRPGLALIDVQLPGMNGIQATTYIKRHLPHVRVVMLTCAKTQDFVRESLRVGADGYVLKDASFAELLLAMRSVMLGKKYLSPDVSCQLVESYLNPQLAASSSPTALQKLTTRERSILQLIAEGRTNRAAAEFLSVSPKTIEKHRASLMRKLGLRSATELALTAIELGLIERPALLCAPGAESWGGVSAQVS